MCHFTDLFPASCEDEDAVKEVLAPRGWNMRNGHRSRFDAPKRGRAAIVAEIQGQGKEVLRGRASFKRSVNNGTRREMCWWLDEPHRKIKAKRVHWQTVACESRELQLYSWDSESQDDSVSDVVQFEEEQHANVNVDFMFLLPLKKTAYSPVDESDAASSPSTTSWVESREAADSSSSWSDDDFNSECGNATSISAPRIPTRWEQAVDRAALAFAQWASTEMGVLENGEGRRKIRNVRGAKEDLEDPLVQELRNNYKTHLSMGLKKTMKATQLTPFEEFRRSFLRKHGARFAASLQHVFNGPVALRPTPLAEEPSQRFLKACTDGGVPGTLVPAFHGTASTNLGSIYGSGLVIPGQGNKVSVVNGSAYGVGIYTANVDSPYLSWGYVRQPHPVMLVCGVLDHDEPAVKKAGAALVVFEERRVAPLFEATHLAGPPVVAKVTLKQHPLILKQQSKVGPSIRQERRRQKRLAKQNMTKLVGVEVFLSRKAARRRRAKASRMRS